MTTPSDAQPVEIAVSGGRIAADLTVGDRPRRLILFAHGSGSSRHSPRNQAVARVFQAQGFATLLADLLTAGEEALDRVTSRLRFDIDLLGRRVVTLIDWAGTQPRLQALPIGLFGASTGAAAALVAAATDRTVGAVVSRGGRPDLAGDALESVRAPTLLIVGGDDTVVLDLNEQALRRLECVKELAVVPGATHLFQEPGALDDVCDHATAWFDRHCPDGRRAIRHTTQ